ncbi:penicillin-binding protein, 1A family [Burkholderiales bacterium JOSHI_001]|nr:penicillin-binding protein, 1A family [Burkholderiales bacterium JOSHI_001]
MADTERADTASSSGPDRPSPRPAASSSRSGWSRVLLRVIGWFFGLVLAGVVSVLLGLALALAVAYPNLPEISGLTDYRPKLPLRIYSADGLMLGEYGEERRSFVPIKEIPKVMQDAVLAIEDSRFYQHSGVDYLGVVRAGVASFQDYKSQGASTITMQVARNFYLSTEKTYTRKIYEILLALKIENQLSKEQILEVYMNQIYLGQRAYGFAAASEIYFGKPLKDVTIAEAAMLAGLPKAPAAYNPVTNLPRATVRQRHIIERMVENNFITAAQAETARNEKLKYREPTDVPLHAEYVAEAARQLVFNLYGNDTYSRGLNVYVTVDSTSQAAAYRALRKGLMDFERRQPFRGPEAYVDLPRDPKDVDTRVAEALVDHPDNDELRAVVVLEASPRKVVAMLADGQTLTITGDGLRSASTGLSERAGPKLQVRRGAVLRALRQPQGNWALAQQPDVEGAFVSMDPRSGQIRALVGGFDYAKNKFNHVTQAWRQPGSAFKPFIYSAALEKGFTPTTVVNDSPLFFDAGATGSQPWEPKNYDGTFEGPMQLKRALARSKNMVSIRVLQSIGTYYAQDWVARFGFDAEKHPPYLTMALGAGSVTPMQMAAGYAMFANGGLRIPPVLITRITDAKGKMLQETTLPVENESLRWIDERNAFVMTRLLGEVTKAGTAAASTKALGRTDIYGKTGTTNDSMDAWFAGFHPSLVAVVWIGYDTPRKLGDKETGGGLALPVWIDYMRQALKGVPVAEAQPPEGLVQIGGEWYFEEYGPGAGVRSVGLEDKVPKPPTDEERSGILDLFKR